MTKQSRPYGYGELGRTPSRESSECSRGVFDLIITQTLSSYKNILEHVLREIDSESKKIGNYAEKIWRAQKLSIIVKDPALNLLALQPSEAAEKAKAIFTVTSNNNIGHFNEIGRQIDAVIQSFYEKKSKVIPYEMQTNLKSINMNFENEEKKLQPALNKYLEAVRIDPNDANAYNGIGDIFFNENRHEEALKHYNVAIKINPNSANYYYNKGNALTHPLRERTKPLEKFLFFGQKAHLRE